MILVTTFKVFINLLVFRRPEALPIVPQLAESKMDMIKSIPVHMDYVGQGRAEKLYQVNPQDAWIGGWGVGVNLI